jgi:DMSO/TMAO reductase YedYZ molybdopterin-dependent catalytic subunit
MKRVTTETGKASSGAGRRMARWGAAAGVIAGFTGIAVGYLLGGIVAPASGPIAAVGESAIGLTPESVREGVISAVGAHDKTVLLAGIYLVLAIYAGVTGALAARRLWSGMVGIAVFTAVGLAAVLTRPDATAAWSLPTLGGSAVAALALMLLVRAAPRNAAAVAPAAPGRKLTGRESPGQRPAVADGEAPAAEEGEERWAVPADWPPLPGPSGQRIRSRLADTERQADRRRFLAGSAAAAGTAAVAYLVGRELTEHTSVSQAQASLRIPRPSRPAPPLPPGSNLKIPGLTSFITPNSSFYRVDTAIILPEVPPDSWQLRVHGMVAREMTINFNELIHRPLTADYITLTCVSNPVGGPLAGNALWVGASLASLLRQAGIRAGASQLLCTSVDGFTSGTPVQTVMDGRDAMLAVAMNGTALPVAHGFPVRLVTPGLYGYVSACKWITDIEVTTFSSANAYWVQQGWAQQAPIKTESRIDVPTGSSTLKPGRTAVAGVAWAQHKGIDAVEVQVDNGPWQEATLAGVPDIDCWRQWVYYWDATPGQHQIQARATDATGYTQTAVQVQPPPNGASGYPSVTVSVSGS